MMKRWICWTFVAAVALTPGCALKDAISGGADDGHGGGVGLTDSGGVADARSDASQDAHQSEDTGQPEDVGDGGEGERDVKEDQDVEHEVDVPEVPEPDIVQDTSGPDATCEQTALTYSVFAPNIYLMVQNSGSMVFNGGDELIRGALVNYFADNVTDVNFGLMVWPGKDQVLSCGIGGVEVLETGSESASMIPTAVHSFASPSGTASLGSALTQARTQGALQSVPWRSGEDKARKAAVIFTNGHIAWPNGGICGVGDAIAFANERIQALQEDGVSVYLVAVNAFGQGDMPHIQNMGDVANTPGSTLQYNSSDAIQRRLDDIVKEMKGCVYQVDDEVSAGQRVRVTLEGAELGDGEFDYDSGDHILVLGEAACEKLHRMGQPGVGDHLRMEVEDCDD